MRIGDNRLCLHTLSDAEDMPGKVATDIRYDCLLYTSIYGSLPTFVSDDVTNNNP